MGTQVLSGAARATGTGSAVAAAVRGRWVFPAPGLAKPATPAKPKRCWGAALQLGAPILGQHHPRDLPGGLPLPGSVGGLWPLVGTGRGRPPRGLRRLVTHGQPGGGDGPSPSPPPNYDDNNNKRKYKNITLAIIVLQ